MMRLKMLSRLVVNLEDTVMDEKLSKQMAKILACIRVSEAFLKDLLVDD